MSELSGTLEGVGLPAILHFLGGLKKTGCLSVVQEGWAGEIFFVSGDVTNAAFGSRHGLQALDALVETLPRASFVFDSEAAQPASRDVTLATDALYQHLDELVADDRNGAPHLPSLDAVPTVVEQPDSGPGEEPAAARPRHSADIARGERRAHRARDHFAARLVRRAVATGESDQRGPGAHRAPVPGRERRWCPRRRPPKASRLEGPRQATCGRSASKSSTRRWKLCAARSSASRTTRPSSFGRPTRSAPLLRGGHTLAAVARPAARAMYQRAVRHVSTPGPGHRWQ